MRFIKNTTLPDDADDLSLLYAYQTGDNIQALGKLYARYMHLVYGVCFSYFKDEEQSKDAVMAIFEELVQKLKHHQISNFKSWLHVLSKNHCLMQLRKTNRYPTETLSDQFMETEGFEHLDMDELKEERLSTMEKCLETLSVEQKTSVELFYLQEKCYKEIAECTGYELGKVKSYIQNGKRNLKTCIEKNHEK